MATPQIAAAIAKPGKRIKAERALDHVAGFMTTNDVSCRDLQIREDRPGLQKRQDERQRAQRLRVLLEAAGDQHDQVELERRRQHQQITCLVQRLDHVQPVAPVVAHMPKVSQ